MYVYIVMLDHPLNCTLQVRCWVLCVPSWVLRSTAAHSPRSLVAFRPTWRDSHCLIQATLSRRTGRNWWRSCPALLAEYALVTLSEFLSCSVLCLQHMCFVRHHYDVWLYSAYFDFNLTDVIMSNRDQNTLELEYCVHKYTLKSSIFLMLYCKEEDSSSTARHHCDCSLL